LEVAMVWGGNRRIMPHSSTEHGAAFPATSSEAEGSPLN
jgi:hypothetical protein